MEEVEIIAFNGHDVANAARLAGFVAADIEVFDHDVLAIGDGGDRADHAALARLEHHDTGVAFLGGHLDGDLALLSGFHHFVLRDGISAGEINLRYLVEIGTKEMECAPAQHGAGTKGQDGDVVAVRVGVEVILAVASCQ